MAMVLGDLLQMVRQDYLDTLLEVWEEARRSDATAQMEPALETGHEWGQGWGDLRHNGAMVVVPSEGVFSFEEPIIFGWGDALPGLPEPLKVTVHPFAWDAMAFQLTPKAGQVVLPEALSQWLAQWAADPEDEEAAEAAPFRAVVHGLATGPTLNTWLADMGSAPLEAWQDLLEAALAAGATELVVGVPPKA